MGRPAHLCVSRSQRPLDARGTVLLPSPSAIRGVDRGGAPELRAWPRRRRRVQSEEQAEVEADASARREPARERAEPRERALRDRPCRSARPRRRRGPPGRSGRARPPGRRRAAPRAAGRAAAARRRTGASRPRPRRPPRRRLGELAVGGKRGDALGDGLRRHEHGTAARRVRVEQVVGADGRERVGLEPLRLAPLRDRLRRVAPAQNSASPRLSRTSALRGWSRRAAGAPRPSPRASARARGRRALRGRVALEDRRRLRALPVGDEALTPPQVARLAIGPDAEVEQERRRAGRSRRRAAGRRADRRVCRSDAADDATAAAAREREHDVRSSGPAHSRSHPSRAGPRGPLSFVKRCRPIASCSSR